MSSVNLTLTELAEAERELIWAFYSLHPGGHKTDRGRLAQLVRAMAKRLRVLQGLLGDLYGVKVSLINPEAERDRTVSLAQVDEAVAAAINLLGSVDGVVESAPTPRHHHRYWQRRARICVAHGTATGRQALTIIGMATDDQLTK